MYVSVCFCMDFLPNKRLHVLQSNGKPITFLEVWREPHTPPTQRKLSTGCARGSGKKTPLKVCNRIAGATMWLAMPFIVIFAHRSRRLQFSTPTTRTGDEDRPHTCAPLERWQSVVSRQSSSKARRARSMHTIPMHQVFECVCVFYHIVTHAIIMRAHTR